MVENLNLGTNGTKVNQGFKSDANKKSETRKVEVSTFAEVRQSKSAPVQSTLDKHLPEAVGPLFVLMGAEYESTPDYNDPDKINHATVYSVRAASKKAWLSKETLTIKVKEQKPIVSDDELEQIMFGERKPIVLAFDDLAHYHFGTGESINASNVRRVNISPREAMNV